MPFPGDASAEDGSGIVSVRMRLSNDPVDLSTLILAHLDRARRPRVRAATVSQSASDLIDGRPPDLNRAFKYQMEFVVPRREKVRGDGTRKRDTVIMQSRLIQPLWTSARTFRLSALCRA